MRKTIITITLENNRFKSAVTNQTIEQAVFTRCIDAINASYKNRMRLSRRARIKLWFKSFSQRMGYIFSAIRTACKKEFSLVDINRHQNGTEV